MSIYLNNAATTWPKPAPVGEAMAAFLARGGANLARGTSSARDMETLNSVLDCRIRVASLLGGWEDADLLIIGDDRNDLAMIERYDGYTVRRAQPFMHEAARGVYDSVGAMLRDHL
mgnify:CR=1 FL=1